MSTEAEIFAQYLTDLVREGGQELAEANAPVIEAAAITGSRLGKISAADMKARFADMFSGAVALDDWSVKDERNLQARFQAAGALPNKRLMLEHSVQFTDGSRLYMWQDWELKNLYFTATKEGEL